MDMITYRHISDTFKRDLGTIKFDFQETKSGKTVMVFQNSKGELNKVPVIEKGSGYGYVYRNLKKIYVEDLKKFQEHILKSIVPGSLYHHSTWHDFKKYAE